MSTTPPPEIWNDILKDNVAKNDPLWQDYSVKASEFDRGMVDKWNEIINVLLLYVGLFISVLTSFISNTISHFQRDPADITNDLLVAIYNQQVAQSNNISIPSVDPTSYFNLSKADYDAAVTQNAILYISLSLSLVVSMIALAVKLWLVSYSHEAFSVGSHYDKAMRRQEAYSGVLLWGMGGVINMLPVILLFALYLFEYYIYMSVLEAQLTLGHVIGAILSLGVTFLVFTSLGAAFVPGCPFRSPFSVAIRFIFEKFQTLSKRILCGCIPSEKLRWLWIAILISLWLATDAAAYATYNTGPWFPLLLFLAGVPVAYSTQFEAVHKPQKYKISRLGALVFLSLLSMNLASCFMNSIFIPLYIIGSLCIISACWLISKVSKSMADTREIDAIAWLITTIPSQHPVTIFQKAGQMTGANSIGRHYRPRLLKSLMPLLTPLITSHHVPDHQQSSDTHSAKSGDVPKGRPLTSLTLVNDNMVPIDEDSHSKNLEIYIACLARLSEFTDSEGTFWCLREDAIQHPKLEQPLIDKLVKLAKPQCRSEVVRSAATKVLNNYKLDMEGNPLRSPTTTVLDSVATFPRNAATSMSNENGLNDREKGPPDPATRVESEEIEDVKSEFGDEMGEA